VQADGTHVARVRSQEESGGVTKRLDRLLRELE
jgi:hypothetical protein